MEGLDLFLSAGCMLNRAASLLASFLIEPLLSDNCVTNYFQVPRSISKMDLKVAIGSIKNNKLI